MAYLFHVVNCCRQSFARKTREISFLPVLSRRRGDPGLVHLGSCPVKTSIARRGIRTLPSIRRQEQRALKSIERLFLASQK